MKKTISSKECFENLSNAQTSAFYSEIQRLTKILKKQKKSIDDMLEDVTLDKSELKIKNLLK